MSDYTITDFDANTGTITVSYSSGTSTRIVLPVNATGETLTGDDLSAYILSFEPKERTYFIKNKEEIEKLVVSSEPLTETIEENDWDIVRKVRNILISQTDYIVTVPDLDISVDEKELWFNYRQALRDITKNTKKIDWPNRPDGNPMPDYILTMLNQINNPKLKPKTKK